MWRAKYLGGVIIPVIAAGVCLFNPIGGLLLLGVLYVLYKVFFDPTRR